MRHFKKHHPAFTIVELLIVIVIIAILAAISIVAYNGIQNRARASEATSALAQAKKQLELYKIDNILYPTTGNLASAGITDGNVTYQYTSDGQTYCITATSGSVSYKTTNTEASSQGGCAGHGQGGVAAVTNVIYNPSAYVTTSGFSNWPGNSGGVSSATSVSATWATRGRACRATWTTGNTVLNGDLGWQFSNNGGSNSLQPNTQYTMSWKVRTSKNQTITPAAANWAILNGAINTGSGTVNASSGAVNVTSAVPVTQWIMFTTGPNTIAVKIYANLATGSSNWNAGDYIEISDLIATRGSTIHNFADGDTPNWVWNGTQNNATSTGPPN